MKKSILIILISIVSMGAFAQNNIDDVFNSFKGQSDVNFITINSSLLQIGALMIDDQDEDAQIAKKMAEQLTGIRLINTETEELGRDLANKVNRLLKSKDYQEMMTVDSNDGNVKFYGKMKGEEISEVFFFVEDKGEYTLISMTGSINPKDVGQFMKKHHKNMN
jgi:hypothetical protein